MGSNRKMAIKKYKLTRKLNNKTWTKTKIKNLKMEAEHASETSCFIKKLGDG
jgi:hypothetical protein